MTTLHDRLAELADDAPPGGPAPELWARGRRYHRVRRAGTLAIVSAAVLVLVAITGLSWQQSGGLPEPAAPPGATRALPDRLWTPSPWLPGTDEDGPLGDLAVVMRSDRSSWSGTEQGLVGVSATTGEYRFLDLPDQEPGDVALSPDGRKVAYWLTGTTSGSPSDTGPVTGVAVYDATTGDVKRADISTEHGLDASALLWADDGELVLSYGQYRGGEGDDPMQQSSATPSEHYWWRLDQDRPQELPMPEGTRRADLVGASGGRVVLTDSTRYWCYYLDQPGFAWPMLGEAGLAMSTQPVFLTTSRFAVVRGSWNPNSILVGDASLRGGARTHTVPDSQGTYEILGWDGDRLIVERGTDGSRRAYVNASVFRVDSRTGRSVELVRLASAEQIRQVQVASDLYDVPTVAGKEPPTPFGPRAVTGGLALVAVLGAGAVVVWRRRVEA